MIINYGRLAEAETYYQKRGFKLVEVPWIIGEAAYNVTRPPEAVPFVTLGGYLVASAEQAYIQQLLEDERLGRCVTTTPCFRHEVYDRWHQPYFVKTELIDTEDTSDASLERMTTTAREFYERFVPTKVIDMGDGSFDIVDAVAGIELGSYGRRTANGITWLYGTGLAEPRLSQVVALTQVKQF